MGPQIGRHHGGQECYETAEAKAEGLLAEELNRRGWCQEELARRRKGDREKVKMAKQLRGETTMTMDWIASPLNMGTGGYAASCLREAAKG